MTAELSLNQKLKYYGPNNLATFLNAKDVLEFIDDFESKKDYDINEILALPFFPRTEQRSARSSLFKPLQKDRAYNDQISSVIASSISLENRTSSSSNCKVM